MERRQRSTQSIIDPAKFGVSFSSKQCHNFKLDEAAALKFLLNELGFRRFRLMSYWNEIEREQGTYDFSSLDKQIAMIEAKGGVITLCLGLRQPRWPESHWPKWVLPLSQLEKYQAISELIEAVVERYKSNRAIISWQLENEALNRSFGNNGDFNRFRLRKELEIVKQLDPSRPIIMTTSNTWGLPLRRPRPDLFGFTLYQTQFKNGKYQHNKIPIKWWSLRAKLIKLILRRPSFIHELQAEPWGPQAIWEMSASEQAKSMNVDQLKKNIHSAKQTNLYPIDLWGGEWWYWRKLKSDDSELVDVIKSDLM